MSSDISSIVITPGITIESIIPHFEKNKCLLIESFGMGGIPISLFDDLVNLFKTSKYSDKFLLIGTQVLNGGTDINTYETGHRLHGNIPFIEAGALTFEMSYIKMMWVLANAANDLKSIEKLYNLPI